MNRSFDYYPKKAPAALPATLPSSRVDKTDAGGRASPGVENARRQLREYMKKTWFVAAS